MFRVSKSAWNKLSQITRSTKIDTFILGLSANKFDNFHLSIKPYDKPKNRYSIDNLNNLKNLDYWKDGHTEIINKTNKIINILVIDPCLKKYVEKIDIDYQKQDYKNKIYEAKFIYDISFNNNDMTNRHLISSKTLYTNNTVSANKNKKNTKKKNTWETVIWNEPEFKSYHPDYMVALA